MSRAVPCAVKRRSSLLLLYADKKFDGVLFKLSTSEMNSKGSVLGQLREQAQAAFALFLCECLHAI